MTRGEHQILELVAFIDKNMVDAHRSEIHHVIGTLTHGKLDILQLNLQVLLTFLQTGEHTLGDTVSLLTQDVQSFLDITKLVIENLFLNLQGLGNLTELVMRHDDAGIVVILDPIEELHSVSRTEILLRGI